MNPKESTTRTVVANARLWRALLVLLRFICADLAILYAQTDEHAAGQETSDSDARLVWGPAGSLNSLASQPAQAIPGINPIYLPAGLQQYRWDQGQGPVRMMAVGDGICGLTAVGGLLRGGGEYVRIDNSSGFWELSGASQQKGVSATARCVPLTLFQTARGVNHSNYSAFVVLISGREVQRQELLSDMTSHSWCWLNGVGGKLASYDGSIDSPQAPHISIDYLQRDGYGAVITAQADNTNNEYLEGRGACINFPGQSYFPRLPATASWGPEDTMRQVQKPLVSLKSGFCILTLVGGDFDSQWDGVSIGVSRFGAQYLYVNAHDWGLGANYRKTPIAAAQCIAYDQR